MDLHLKALNAAMLALACVAAQAASDIAHPALLRDEPITPIPLTTDVDPAHAALGRRLFSDTRLSRDGAHSCASCHALDHGGVDNRQSVMPGTDGKLRRDTPTVFNVGFNIAFNWDGSGRSLEAVTRELIVSPSRFDNTWPHVLETLSADKSYVAAFKSSYRDGLTIDNTLDALTSYLRALATPNARFDRYLRGDPAALTAAEKHGYGLFKSFGCVACHQGMNVGGNLYQKFGIFRDTSNAPTGQEMDPGRMRVTHDARDYRVFRVPSLRNVQLTPPYFHDGSAATLHDAVRTMAKVQLDRNLSDGDVDAIVQFLCTLTGELDGHPLASPAGPQGQQAQCK